MSAAVKLVMPQKSIAPSPRLFPRIAEVMRHAWRKKRLATVGAMGDLWPRVEDTLWLDGRLKRRCQACAHSRFTLVPSPANRLIAGPPQRDGRL